MPICALCGAESRGGGQFCRQCGGAVAGDTRGVLVATQEPAPDREPALSLDMAAEHRDGAAQEDLPIDLQEALRHYNASRFKTAVMCLERAEIQAQQNDDRRAGEKIIEIGSALAANRLVHPKLRQECERVVSRAREGLRIPQETVCSECGETLHDGDEFCPGCGLPLRRDSSAEAPSTCPNCGTPTPGTKRFCGRCGQALEQPDRTAVAVPQFSNARSTLQRTATSAYTASPSAAGAPGVGIAGFVLSLLGVSLLGLILSWVGYAQAKREGRPTGLCVAGIIIGIVGLVATVIVTIIILSAAASGPSYYGE
jgi:predicted amidophosphoribosyltransferase